MDKNKLIELNNQLEEIQFTISKTQKYIGSLLKNNCSKKVGGYMKKHPLKVTNMQTNETHVFDSLRKASRFLRLGENGSKLSRKLKKHQKITIDNYIVEPYNESEEVELP